MAEHIKKLPDNITSYDLLKTFAIITMIIDHIGYYFYPELIELRVIGRTSAPVWSFLIGYAMTRKLDHRLWVGAVVLLAVYIFYGLPPLPLNILFTFLLMRFTLNFFAVRAAHKFETAFAFFWLFILLAIPTGMIIEYGTLAFMMGMLGYLCRRRNEIALNEREVLIYTILSCLGYCFIQSYWFGFDQIDIAILAVLIGITGMMLYQFKSVEFPKFTQKIGPAKHVLFLTGRRTLEIYVIHIIAFIMLSHYGVF